MKTVTQLIDSLADILNGMDIPEQRKAILVKVSTHRACLNNTNLLWLQRNIWIRNDNHPDILKAQEIIKTLLDSN